MKSIATWIAIASVAATTATATAAPYASFQDKKGEKTVEAPYKDPKKRIAVMSMDASTVSDSALKELIKIYKTENNSFTTSDVGNKLTEMLTTALDSTGRFILLERAAIQDVRDEIAVGQELGNEKTSVKKGNVLGAQMLIRAAVTEFVPNKKTRGGGISLGGISVGGGGNEAAVTLDIRFVDPNTSQILYTAKAEGSSKSSSVGIGLNLGGLGIGGGQSTNQPIEKATRDAIEKAVKLVIEKLAPIAWEARVAKVDSSGALILNRGSNDGLQVGDTLKVYAPGETIEDPETGETLGRSEDKLVGEATISWVSDRVAKATFTGSGKVVANYVLKFTNK